MRVYWAAKKYKTLRDSAFHTAFVLEVNGGDHLSAQLNQVDNKNQSRESDWQKRGLR